jgi:hypothetical protein
MKSPGEFSMLGFFSQANSFKRTENYRNQRFSLVFGLPCVECVILQSLGKVCFTGRCGPAPLKSLSQKHLTYNAQLEH